MGTDVRTAQQQQLQSQQQRSQQQQQSQQQLQQQGKRVSFSEEQEAFRPSYEVFTPGRAALGSVQYRAPEKRVPGAVAPASTVARPNYHDAIRRVSVVVFQHIQVRSCTNISFSSSFCRSCDSVRAMRLVLLYKSSLI
jgi:transcription initiation factor TFIID subunit TAF12